MKNSLNKIADDVNSGKIDIATGYASMYKFIKIFTKECYDNYASIYIEADIYWEDLMKDTYPPFINALNDWLYRKSGKNYSFKGFLHKSINKYFDEKLKKIKNNLSYIKAFVKTFKFNNSIHMGIIILNDELLSQLKTV